MSKGFNRPRHTKTGQWSSGIKSYGLINQSFKSLAQIGGSMCSKDLVKEQQALVSHQS